MKRFHFARVNESGLTLEAMSATIRMGEVIKIGSHAQCAIRVKDDHNVLSMHATIELVEGKDGAPTYRINNCGVSAMLLRVNNVPVDRSFRLEVGDVIRVGKTLLRLDAIDDAEDKSVSPSQVRELPDDLSEVLNKVVAFLGLPKPDGSWTGMALAFAKWLAFAQAFVADPDGQHQATWTETMLRVIGTRGMMKGNAEAVESCEIADAVLREKVKRFPPRMMSYGGNELDVNELCAIDDLEKAQDELRQWREATGCASLDAFYAEEAKHNAAMSKTYRDLDDLQNQVDEWRKATGFGDPVSAKVARDNDAMSHDLDSYKQMAVSRGVALANWHNTFGGRTPERVEQLVKDDRLALKAKETECSALRVQIIHWQNATSCSTPEEAHELISDTKHKWELEILKCVDVTNERNIARRTAELAGEKLTRWRMVTGYEDPGAYKNHLEREANLADVHDRMIAERDQTIIEYAKEIDRLRDSAKKASRDCADAERVTERWREEVMAATKQIDLLLGAANKLEDGIIEARKAADINHQKLGSDDYVSLDVWCNDANVRLRAATDTIAHVRKAFGGATVDRICEIGKMALIPLPKPDKVEAGQKWAFVFNAIEGESSDDYEFEDPRSWEAYTFKKTELSNQSGAIYLGSS